MKNAFLFLPLFCFSQLLFSQFSSENPIVVQKFTDRLQAIDMDNDGDNDILSFHNTTADNQLGWYENVGLGEFGIYRAFEDSTTSTSISNMEKADIDGDGIDDLVYGRYGVHWKKGLGGMEYSDETEIVDFLFAERIYARDFDEDMDIDILFYNDDNVHLLVNDGDGNFTNEIILDGPFSSAGFYLDIGDIDNDGFIDIVVAHYSDLFWYQNNDNNFDTFFQLSDSLMNNSYLYVEDVDQDGNLDIIGFVGSNDVAVALGNGDGTFQNQVSHDVSQFINAGGDIEVGDLDGDDVLDMFVINYDYAHILIGNGDGTFNTLVTYQLGGDAFDGDLGDFNNDGILDVVSNNFFTSGDLFVRLGNGDGTFGDTVTYSTSGATMFQQELGDLNGDGQLDILTVTDTTASVFLGQSDGTFADEITTSHTTLGTFSLKDFDLDGELDYVVRQNATNIVFHKGNGDGTFAAGVTSTVTNANSISYADVNDDGYYDLVNNDTASTGYFLGNGDGTFGAYVEVEANGTNSISVGDYNSDGATDLIIQDTNLTTAYLANTNKESSLQYFDLTSSKTAEKAVGIITDTIDRINLEKGAQNAQRSRLSAAADVVAITSENYRTASDKILELDVADEVAEMVRLQIVQQAATAVLAQANQEGGRALSLLA